jgi:hypothetical protein
MRMFTRFTVALLVVGAAALVAAAPMPQPAGAASAAPPGGQYLPLSPTRVCDTRAGKPSQPTVPAEQCVNKTIVPGTSTDPLNVSLAAFLDASRGATAIVVNVTAVNPGGPGWLTVYPAGSSRPNASNLNVTAKAVVANLVEVAVGAADNISIYSSTRSDVVVDLEGYVPATDGAGSGVYTPLPSPVRICDTRPGIPSNPGQPATQCNNQPLQANTPRAITAVDPSFQVPPGAIAVVANVTAVSPVGPGWLTVYPDGLGKPPTASNVNYTAKQVIPNRAIVTLGVSDCLTTRTACGRMNLFSSQATNVIVDISGYYTASGGAGGRFTALQPTPSQPSPVRICDTRGTKQPSPSDPASQCNGKALGPGGMLTVDVGGQFSSPQGAAAAVLNVTAINPSQTTFLTIYTDGSRPFTSDLNPPAGGTEPNLVVAPLSAEGTFTVYNYAGTVNIAIDLAGWYQSAPAPPTGLTSVPGLGALSWTAPAQTGGSPIVGYNIFEGTSPGKESPTPVNGSPIPGTSSPVSGLTTGSTYYFTVAAVNALGSFGASNEVSISPWRVTNPAEPPVEQWAAISCPTPDFCAAVGGSSGDAAVSNGGHWGRPDHIDPPAGLSLLSCASSTLCVAVDQGTGALFDYDGHAWTQHAGPSSVPIVAVSCAPSAAFCLLVDNADNTFTSVDGVNWSPGADLLQGTLPHGVTCLSSTSCLAMLPVPDSSGVTYTLYSWNGTNWSAGASLPSTLTVSDFVGEITCASATICVIPVLIGSSNVLYTYDGTAWMVASTCQPGDQHDCLPTGYNPKGPVTCAFSSDCFSMGVNSSNGPAFLEYASGTWSTVANGTQAAFPGSATQLSCGSDTVCAAVSVLGGGVNTFDGTSWTLQPVGGNTQLQSISCPTSSFCAAVDNGGNYVTFDGTGWSAAAPVTDGSHTASAFAGLGAISCPAPKSCTAIDSSGNAWGYAGASWTLSLAVQSIVSSKFSQGDISCPTTQFCAVVSGAGAATYDGGTGNWTLAQLPATQTLDSVSCTSSSFCIAVDQKGFYTTWNGSSWSSVTLFAGSSESVSCLSSSLCVAAGGDGNAETYNGTGWSNAVQLAPGGTLGNPSCAPASGSLSAYCAVSAPHAVYYYTVSASGVPTWSGAQTIPDNSADSILALSCASLLCMATGVQNHGWQATP